MGELTGGRLGPYRIESLIGRGGMGDVYLAHHERLDRPCALKILRPQLAVDRELRERFVREAQAAARLDHPNIVTIYDAGEEDGVAYFAMQLVEGEPLTALIGSGRLSTSEALGIVRDVAAALDAAHQGGLVHRDVKPANIIIAPDGKAMLTDFGIVHLRPEAQLTVTGQLLGTPAYMAPEQIAGGEITPQTDVYQLAIVAYELLTGSLPFAASEPAALLVAHLHESPAPADEVVEGLPSAVATTLNQALHKLPTERPHTAPAFVDALEAALGDPDFIARPTTGRRTSQIARSRETTVPSGRGRWPFGLTPVRVGIAIAVVVLAAAGTAAAWSLIAGDGAGDGSEGESPEATSTAVQTPAEIAGAASPQTTEDPATREEATATDEDTETLGDSSEQAIFIVEPNLEEPPISAEVMGAYDVGELWPPPPLDGVGEYTEDGIPRMVLDAPDVSVTRLTLGAEFGDGSAFLEASLLSIPDFYAEQCLLARVNAIATSGYGLCLTSNAETFAFYFDNDVEPPVWVELLPPERRLGTRSPDDWNALEIRAIDDRLWFLINNTLLGAAKHDGPRFGEIGVTAFREGDQPFEIGWGVLATLELEPA